MKAEILDIEDKKLKAETEDIEEMILLLKELDSYEKREIKGIMVGLKMAKQEELTA